MVHEFKASLGYIVGSRSAWAMRLLLKKERKKRWENYKGIVRDCKLVTQELRFGQVLKTSEVRCAC
jgi:hypothetical protein